MSGRLYDAAYTIFGRWRGGLAMATIVATAGFSAICGSTSATAAAMGKVAIPEMSRYGYDPGLACGCMAAPGSLGIMIPPSTIFIIYGILAQHSIGKLFIAGVVPGLILAGLFISPSTSSPAFNPTAAPAGDTDDDEAEAEGHDRHRRDGHPVRAGHRRPLRRVVQPHPGRRGGHGRRPSSSDWSGGRSR